MTQDIALSEIASPTVRDRGEARRGEATIVVARR